MSAPTVQRIEFPDGLVMYRCRICRSAYDWDPGVCCTDGKPGKEIVLEQQASHMIHPGTKLKYYLTKFFGFRSCGRCETFSKKMDSWGTEGCREHMDEIVDHLRKQAEQRAIIVPPDWTIKMLVSRVIAECEKAISKRSLPASAQAQEST